MRSKRGVGLVFCIICLSYSTRFEVCDAVSFAWLKESQVLSSFYVYLLGSLRIHLCHVDLQLLWNCYDSICYQWGDRRIKCWRQFVNFKTSQRKKDVPYRPFLVGGRKGVIEVIFTHGPIFSGAIVSTMEGCASDGCRGTLWIGSIFTPCRPWTSWSNQTTLANGSLITVVSGERSSKCQTESKTHL